MNISEIQAELRKIGGQLQRLEQELEDLKPNRKTPDLNSDNYVKIERMAGSSPIINSALERSSGIVKKRYVQFLSVIASIKKDDIAKKLMYIYRVAIGAKLWDLGVKEIAAMGYSTQPSFIGEMADLGEPLKYTLLTDSLILAGISGKPDDEEIKVISDFAGMLKCTAEDMAVISTVAGCILKDNFDSLDEINITQNKWTGVFSRRIPQEWLLNRRTSTFVNKQYKPYTNSKSKEVNPNQLAVKNGDIVKKGQRLGNNGVSGDLLAKENGIFYKKDTPDSYFYAYTYNYFDDFDDVYKWGQRKIEEAMK
ncbi:MAG: hypothetical protein LUG66_05270 [Clostridiales bacterium]|nr:hypothetical protein [Clostridiales bacterium]